MRMDSLELFFITMVIVNIIPGPAMLYCLSQTSRHGLRTGLLAVLGVEFGTFVYVISVAFGLAVLILSSPKIFHLIQFLGACYLIYLGVKDILAYFYRPQLPIGEMPPTRKKRAVFWQGVFINLFNPKVALFLIAFLPQFITANNAHASLQLLLLGLLFNAGGLLTNCLVAIFSHAAFIRPLKTAKPNNFIMILKTWVPAMIFIGLGLLMLWTDL